MKDFLKFVWKPFGNRNPFIRSLFYFDDQRLTFDGSFNVRSDFLPVERVVYYNQQKLHIKIIKQKVGAKTEDDNNIITLYYKLLDVCTEYPEDKLQSIYDKIIYNEKIKINLQNIKTMNELKQIVESRRASLDLYRPMEKDLLDMERRSLDITVQSSLFT